MPGFDYRHATWDEVCEINLLPHPELVKAQKPSAALFMAAALCLGVFPNLAAPYLAGEARASLDQCLEWGRGAGGMRLCWDTTA